jgi:hypothetical protein
MGSGCYGGRDVGLGFKHWIALCPGSYMATGTSHKCSKLQFPPLIKRAIKPQELEVLFKHKKYFYSDSIILKKLVLLMDYPCIRNNNNFLQDKSPQCFISLYKFLLRKHVSLV